MSLENPFSKKPILPPEQTNPQANEALIASLLGATAAQKYRETLSGETSQPPKAKPTFNLDAFDATSFDTHELENRLDLTKQYENQKRIFQSIGLLETREDAVGMTDIEGNWHNFPTLEEVQARIEAKQELITTKERQGFKKLLIVPFGIPLQQFAETMKRTLLAHSASMQDPSDSKKTIPDPTKTRFFSKNKDGTKIPLDLDTNEPLWVWDKYQNADKNNSIVYFPEAFTEENHRGKTKKQLIQENAYHILLLEETTDIPREGDGKTIGERHQLEANKKPQEYLDLFTKDPNYQNEHGLTPEAWLTYFLLHLEQTNEVIDDYSGSGSLNYHLGAYFPASGDVSGGYWNRGNRRASLDRDDPSGRYSDSGSRSAVMV